MKQTNGMISKMDLKEPRVKVLYWILFILITLLSLVCLFPSLWVILSSLKDTKEFFAIPPTIIPKSLHFDKLVQIWKKLKFNTYYINTFILTAGVLFFTIVLNAAMGFVLSKLKPKGSKIIFLLILWTMMLPNTMGMVPVYKKIINFPIIHVNLTNTFWPMWLMAGANAFYVIIFKGFFDGIPQALVEAARIDGCTDLGIFFKIILPLSKPVLMAVSIFTVNGVWSDFFWPYMVLKNKNLQTVIVGIYNMKGTYPMDVQFAALTFAIIPPAIFFMIFQKYIMQGFTLSGIKE